MTFEFLRILSEAQLHLTFPAAQFFLDSASYYVCLTFHLDPMMMMMMVMARLLLLFLSKLFPFLNDRATAGQTCQAVLATHMPQ